jgi:hypothetical protein
VIRQRLETESTIHEVISRFVKRCVEKDKVWKVADLMTDFMETTPVLFEDRDRLLDSRMKTLVAAITAALD